MRTDRTCKKRYTTFFTHCSVFTLFIILISLFSGSASAATFIIPHDDEVYQVQDMKEEGAGQQVAAFESTLEQLQAEIQMLLLLVDGRSAFTDRYAYGQIWRRENYHSDARYRSCVRDLIDDQYNLLRDAAKSGVEVSDEDLADFRSQERKCRKYARRSFVSYLDWIPYLPYKASLCRSYDPFVVYSPTGFDSYDDYIEWRRVCERRTVDYYDSFFGSVPFFDSYYSYHDWTGYDTGYDGYYDGYPDSPYSYGYPGYSYGDDVTHPYYYDTAGYAAPFYGLAMYGNPFMPTSAVITYNSPEYYFSADLPGVTRPSRGPLSYSSDAYTEWKNNCLSTTSIDGRFSDWCARTAYYWADEPADGDGAGDGAGY
ncbi:hypothetical protein HYS47_00110 [Candidatus Woesearchaeota archaeon]|nr:hypothetical protein [Candidatus Woesearchaeota archaeon]